MKDIEKRQNFLSVDGQIARSSLGLYFKVGEKVAHQDKEAGTATIERFEPILERDEIRVHTDKGYAHLDFLEKLNMTIEDASDVSIFSGGDPIDILAASRNTYNSSNK